MPAGWKKYAQLLKKKRRQAEKKFLVEGALLCQEALRSAWETEIAFVSETFTRSPHWDSFRETFAFQKLPWRILPDQHIQQLSDTETPQGIVLVMRMPSYNLEALHPKIASLVIILQGIRDPGNLGTIIRTSDWYGADAVILSGDCVDPFNPKVLRGTMGSIFHLPVFVSLHLEHEIRTLKQQAFQIIASAVGGEQVLHKTRFKKPLALILGSEVQGVSAEVRALADETVRIRKYGKAESLNVAVAGGILMNQIADQFFQAKKT